jgi:glycosyltransferase involved in cell wall biosynthesis
MHIAMVGWLKGKSVPPKGYGGIERFTEILSLGLASGLGHQVTVLAPAGSKVDGCEVIECNDMVEAVNILSVIKPDVIHDNTCWDLQSPVRQGLKAPFLSTTHVNHAIGWTKNVVYLSQSQRTQHGIQVERNLNFSPIVRVPFDPRFDRWPINGGYNPNSDYCLFIGTVAEWKGVEEAAKLAIWLGKKLIVAGPAAGAYADIVKNYRNVEMRGEVDGFIKEDLIQRAFAVMCLHNNYGGWQEPGCGVVSEANAFNVPVFALNNGCLPELVHNGVNGWIADKWEELPKIFSLKPVIETSEKYAFDNWYVTRIASEYVNLYGQLLNGVTWG